MSVAALKKRILSNTFVTSIRYHHVDALAFEELCIAMEELSECWGDAKSIDKALAGELYTIVLVTEYASQAMKVRRDKDHKVVADMAHRLDGLVFKCL